MFGCLAEKVVCGPLGNVKAQLKVGELGIWITPTEVKPFDLEKLR
jgi:hypothetical protein